MDAKHLLHRLIVGPTTANDERLRSRHLFVPAALKPLNELFKLSIRAAQCTDHKWDVKYSEVYQSYVSLSQGLVPGHLALVCPDFLGSDATAFALVLEDFSHPCTNGDFRRAAENTKERIHRRKVILDFVSFLLLRLRCFVFRNFKPEPSPWSSRRAVPLPLLAWLYILIISLELVYRS